MHGSIGSGPPLGNRNAWRHGRRSRAAGELRLLQHLLVAADAALLAELHVVDVVGRGADDEFDAAVQNAAVRRDRLTQAAASLERLLVLSGRGNEARELLGEVPSLVREFGARTA